MPIRFRALCSGSSGNSVMVWDNDTRLLIDCGVRAQYRCREMLDRFAAGSPPLSAVVVSHLHSDHINYSSLRVIEERRVPIYVHDANTPMLSRLHFRNHPFSDLDVRSFGDQDFTVGGFRLRPVGLPHAGHGSTHGFVVASAGDGRGVRLALATDLYDWAGIVQEFVDADFVYLEANHDPELLRRRPNPNSAYHLENRCSAEFLCEILRRSRRAPLAVMLAHLSEERNTPQIALSTVRAVLREAGCPPPHLHVAPRHTPSPTIELDDAP